MQQLEELDRVWEWLRRNADAFSEGLDFLNENPGLAVLIMAENPVPWQETPMREFAVELGRRWHNFVASVATMVNHVRAVTESQTSEFQQECADQRKLMLDTQDVVQFTSRARDFLQHAGLLNFTLSWKFNGSDGRVTKQSYDVSLSTEMLLNRNSKWGPRGRAYIQARSPRLQLGASVTEYMSVAQNYRDWFHERLYDEHYEEAKEFEALARRRYEIKLALEGADPEPLGVTFPTPDQMRSAHETDNTSSKPRDHSRSPDAKPRSSGARSPNSKRKKRKRRGRR